MESYMSLLEKMKGKEITTYASKGNRIYLIFEGRISSSFEKY